MSKITVADMKRADLALTLSYDAVHAVPMPFDFGGEEEAETWAVHDQLCTALDALEGSECDEDQAWSETDWDPMMSYAYPLPGFRHSWASDVNSDMSELESARRLVEALNCCTLIEIGGESYLALTGGGMDLSDRICETYVALGYYPPAHFLPFGNLGNSYTVDFLAACLESLETVALRATRAVEEFKQRSVSYAIRGES